MLPGFEPCLKNGLSLFHNSRVFRLPTPAEGGAMFEFASTAKPVEQAPIGLLAGHGRFPIIFAQKARQQGIPLVCVGLQDEASPELEGLADRFYWVGMAKLGRTIRCFKREGVRQIVMAGKLHKVKLNASFRILRYLPDWRMLRAYFFQPRKDNKDDTLLLAYMAEFEKDGMTFASALDFCPELLVKTGILTQRGLSAPEEADIAFGW